VNDPIPQIDVEDFARRHAEGAYVLDVRQPDEYEDGHVPGAHLVPLDQLAERAAEVPRGGPVFVVCRSGGRSAAATVALNDAGWEATNVVGGTQAWLDAGHPVVTGPAER
jgi:rhodanese-related sulfurtransferase